MSGKCVVIREKQLQEVLALPPVQGKRSLEPLRSFAVAHGIPLHIVEDHEVITNRAEVHVHESDFWICLEGMVQFICGGELVDPMPYRPEKGGIDYREWSSLDIIGGEQFTLQAGDMLWIPAGQPHQHNCIGTSRLLLVKVPR